MFEIREDKKFKGWFRIFIETSNGNYLMSSMFSSLEKAEEVLKEFKALKK